MCGILPLLSHLGDSRSSSSTNLGLMHPLSLRRCLAPASQVGIPQFSPSLHHSPSMLVIKATLKLFAITQRWLTWGVWFLCAPGSCRHLLRSCAVFGVGERFQRDLECFSLERVMQAAANSSHVRSWGSFAPVAALGYLQGGSGHPKPCWERGAEVWAWCELARDGHGCRGRHHLSHLCFASSWLISTDPRFSPLQDPFPAAGNEGPSCPSTLGLARCRCVSLAERAGNGQ